MLYQIRPRQTMTNAQKCIAHTINQRTPAPAIYKKLSLYMYNVTVHVTQQDVLLMYKKELTKRVLSFFVKSV